MHNNQCIFVISILALSCLLPGVSAAGAWTWMEQSPVSHFTPEDKQIMRTTARDALDNAKDGTKIGWENPETGHSGSVKPINTTERDGLTCRKTRFFNSAEGLTAIQIHRLCRQKDGTWKIAK